ncbi:MAG: GNAT family N-acetyltransferase [Sneathiella sp.]|nr:GNAT family N-acetyltransferase [Sneathiella sp.]
MKNITLRIFAETDAADVRDLFIKTNRLLAPPHLKNRFEDYITVSLTKEIGRISDYYAEKQGNFWVATCDTDLVGMFGLEPSGANSMELRRMYVNRDWRRQGIAQKMLQFAEDTCRSAGIRRLDLSTSELQGEALSFYRNAGYDPEQEVIADQPSNKTIGGGIRRFYFKKML